MKSKVHILLPDIRSAYNVGSIFRSADCFGTEKIYLSGTTPTPLDRFGRSNSGAQKEISKTALGAEKDIPWEYVLDVNLFLKKMKKEKFSIVCIEQDKKSITLDNFIKIKNQEKINNLLVIFGNEVEGVKKTILKKADYIVEIPMKGKKESLNVSVCAGLIMYVL
ncbi:TrmH family RNA methyltransferase [Arenimonas sp.]|nr:TrmH family RNA methyltransferase [Candidatus Parcubacteria bacterium]